MKEKVFSLPNGLRVVHKYVPYTPIVHCGFVVDAGSRDDPADGAGMAHFIEHMIFKGTTRRKTFHIVNYLESVGGDLNAYTDKEKTCVYASLRSEYFDRAVELLTDICFHSVFPPKEIKKEKQVVKEEIGMYRNAPDEAIFEDFDLLIYPKHALGRPVLGTEESVASFSREQLQAHIKAHYASGRLVFAVVGNITEKQLNKMIAKYLRDLELDTTEVARTKPGEIIPQSQFVEVPHKQAYEIYGGTAYPLRKDKYFAFLLLNNLLGGPAMNTRLNLNIREKHGLTYSVSTFYAPYLDSGLWGIYYTCEPGSLAPIRRLIGKELRDLKIRRLGQVKLAQAKRQLIGQLTLSYENLLSQMIFMAKDLLDFNNLRPYDYFVGQIEAITAEDILEAANEIFDPERLSMITYAPAG